MREAPTLFPDAVRTKPTDTNFFLYWRKPDGWIVAAPGWPQEYAKRVRQGWEALPQYGTFTPGQVSKDIRGIRFNPHLEPWRVICQKGGAKEFPLEQVIAFNWHLAPPYKEVELPQLEGVEVDVLDCPECNVQPFHDPQHLAQHLRIRHDYTRLDLVTYGKEMGIDFSKRERKDKARRLEVPEEEKATLTVQKVERGEPCGIGGCTWAPSKKSKNPGAAMAGHRRMKHSVGRKTASEGATDGRIEMA